jgi:outer membrane lipoprotein-sorting protein
MRQTARLLAALGLLLGLAAPGRAADEAAAIIDKAVKAHFPKGMDTKNQGLRTKSKGTLHIAGMDLAFTQDVAVQSPDKFKEVMELTVMDKAVTVTSVYNGKEAWIRAGDQDVKVTEEILTEFKEAAYGMGLMQGVFLKDKSVTFTLVGEVKVKGKAAVGVTASRKGNKDINLYFDKETGLLAKVEMRRRDLMSGEEVTEERIITEYQDADGRKVAKKVEVLRDGKAFLEAEVTELKVLEKVDDSEFARPK